MKDALAFAEGWNKLYQPSFFRQLRAFAPTSKGERQRLEWRRKQVKLTLEKHAVSGAFHASSLANKCHTQIA
jgi:hypothetical protein